MTPFPPITAEKQTLQSKKLEEKRSKHAFYKFTHSDSEPKIFRIDYPTGVKELEQEKIWAC